MSRYYDYILNSIMEKDELNKKLWDGTDLKPEVAEHLIQIAEEFLNTFSIDLKVDDIHIVGSNAGYNYKDKSDIDLHVITDFTQYPAEVDIMDELFNAKKNNFNNNYDIEIAGCPVELYIEDSNNPAESNGRYSIQSRTWIQQPQYIEEPELDKELYDQWKEKIEDTIKTQDREAIESLIDEIWDSRKEDIKANGFVGAFNLVFKRLRANGVLDKLREERHKVISKDLSLKEGLRTSTLYKKLLENEDAVYCSWCGVEIPDTAAAYVRNEDDPHSEVFCKECYKKANTEGGPSLPELNETVEIPEFSEEIKSKLLSEGYSLGDDQESYDIYDKNQVKLYTLAGYLLKNGIEVVGNLDKVDKGVKLDLSKDSIYKLVIHLKGYDGNVIGGHLHADGRGEDYIVLDIDTALEIKNSILDELKETDVED